MNFWILRFCQSCNKPGHNLAFLSKLAFASYQAMSILPGAKAGAGLEAVRGAAGEVYPVL